MTSFMILLYETKATLQLLIRGNYRSNIDSGEKNVFPQ